MTPIKRILLILLFIGIGLGFGIGSGIIFYKILKKKDDQIKLGACIEKILIPSIFFWVTIAILIIVKKQYQISLHLFIISGIILASFLSAIHTKTVLIFIFGFGLVITGLGLESFFRKTIGFIICRVRQMKAKNAEKKSLNIPEPSAPPLDVNS